MIRAYNQNHIDSHDIRSFADKLLKKGLFTSSLHKIALSTYRDNIYSPTFFVKLGLFIFSIIISFSGMSLLYSLFFAGIGSWSTQNIGVVSIIYAAGHFFFLEKFIRKGHFKSGIDNALLYIATGLLITGLLLIFNLGSFSQLPVSIAGVIFFTCAIRYRDPILTVLSIICFLTNIFLLLAPTSIGSVILPFVFMFIGLVLYLIAVKYLTYAYRYWRTCLIVMQVSGLVCFYLSGNYFVVKEGNAMLHPAGQITNKRILEIDNQVELINKKNSVLENELNNLPADSSKESTARVDKIQKELASNNQMLDDLYKKRNLEVMKIEAEQKHEGIPLGWLFIFFTITVPLIYIVSGVVYKKKIVLRTGMLLLVGTVVTIRYYFSIAPPEVALTIGGLGLLTIGLITYKFFKHGRFGISSVTEDVDEETSDFEGLVIGQVIKDQEVPQPGLEFGDGEFGGGGAGGKY